MINIPGIPAAAYPSMTRKLVFAIESTPEYITFTAVPSGRLNGYEPVIELTIPI